MYLAFDFGYKRIGTAVGQAITKRARPLITLAALSGVPDWKEVKKLINEWQPEALIVGLPTTVDDTALYTTNAAKQFALQLQEQFDLPVHLVDERMTTVEARSQLFARGGYRYLKKTSVDNLAACLILEQWMNEHLD